MAKQKSVFFCTECGNETPKWYGQCPACRQWDTMKEHIEKPSAVAKGQLSPMKGVRKAQRIQEITTDEELRFSTGMGELDRVLGTTHTHLAEVDVDVSVALAQVFGVALTLVVAIVQVAHLVVQG